MKSNALFLLFAGSLLAAVWIGCRNEEEPLPEVTFNPLMERTNWTIASIPIDEEIDSARGRLQWWNPNLRDAVLIRDVFPDSQISTQNPNILRSLILQYEPDSMNGDPGRSWGGIMTYLGDTSLISGWFEIWLRMPPQPQGRLVLDLGDISEDALPNDSLNSEDRPLPGQVITDPQREYGDGLLTPDEDTGLDGFAAVDPLDRAHWNGPNKPAVPSYDDWFYTAGSSDFSSINGTEADYYNDEGNQCDTEDLNDNDRLELANDYFSYGIRLDFNNPLIVDGQNNPLRWRLFRVPLDGGDGVVRRQVGQPDLTTIRYARLYLTGMTSRGYLETVLMKLRPAIDSANR